MADLTTPPKSDEELARHGIQRVPTDVFLVDGYRYSNLTDALAAARRAAAR